LVCFFVTYHSKPEALFMALYFTQLYGLNSVIRFSSAFSIEA
jgi:hypothetical protein